MIKIVLTGSTDVDEYFRISGVFDYEQLNHTPFLVFNKIDDTLHVQIIDNAKKLLTFPDETPVMGQWRGEWRSDYFQFNVGKYRQFLEAKNAALVKTIRHVVKRLGPLGGFRSLSYKYTDDNGTIVSTSVCSKSEAERLEAVFLKNNIPVEIQKE